MAAPDGVGHFGHIDGAGAVHGDAVGRDELAGAFAFRFVAEHTDAAAVAVVDGYAVAQAGGVVHAAHAVQLAHIDMAAPIDHRVGAVDVVPHFQEVAVGVKELDAVALPVNDINPLVLVEGDVVGSDELAGVNAGFAPGELVLPLRAVHVDAGVAVAVGDVDVAVAGSDGGGGGAVEGLAAPAGGGMVFFADFHQLFAGDAELLDGVDAVVGGQEGVVRRAVVQAVGAVGAEVALSERPLKVAVLVKDHNGVFAAGQNEHAVVAVHGYAGAFQQPHSVGQLEPVGDKVVPEIAFAINFGHNASPLRMCGLLRLRLSYWAMHPPSMTSSAPVTKDASSEARYSTP